MKLFVYFDVFQWSSETNPPRVFTNLNPNLKADNAVRYKVEIEIPDPMKPDAILKGKVTEEGQEISNEKEREIRSEIIRRKNMPVVTNGEYFLNTIKEKNQMIDVLIGIISEYLNVCPSIVLDKRCCLDENACKDTDEQYNACWRREAEKIIAETKEEIEKKEEEEKDARKEI
jgi:hypothetical protein